MRKPLPGAAEVGHEGAPATQEPVAAWWIVADGVPFCL